MISFIALWLLPRFPLDWSHLAFTAQTENAQMVWLWSLGQRGSSLCGMPPVWTPSVLPTSTEHPVSLGEQLPMLKLKRWRNTHISTVFTSFKLLLWSLVVPLALFQRPSWDISVDVSECPQGSQNHTISWFRGFPWRFRWGMQSRFWGPSLFLASLLGMLTS